MVSQFNVDIYFSLLMIVFTNPIKFDPQLTSFGSSKLSNKISYDIDELKLDKSIILEQFL